MHIWYKLKYQQALLFRKKNKSVLNNFQQSTFYVESNASREERRGDALINSLKFLPKLGRKVRLGAEAGQWQQDPVGSENDKN